MSSSKKRSASELEEEQSTDAAPLPPEKRPRTDGHSWDETEDKIVLNPSGHKARAQTISQSRNLVPNILSYGGIENLVLFLPCAPSDLMFIDVSNILMGIDGSVELVYALASMPSIQVRAVRMNNVGMCGTGDAYRFSNAIRRNAATLAIRELSLRDNVFGEEGVLIVAHALRCLCNLSIVDLHGCAPDASIETCTQVRQETTNIAVIQPEPTHIKGTVTIVGKCRNDTMFTVSRYMAKERLLRLSYRLNSADIRAKILELETSDAGLRFSNVTHHVTIYGDVTVKQVTSVLCNLKRYINGMQEIWEYVHTPTSRLWLETETPERPISLDPDALFTDSISPAMRNLNLFLMTPHRNELQRRACIVWLFNVFGIPFDVARKVYEQTTNFVKRDVFRPGLGSGRTCVHNHYEQSFPF